MSNPKNAFYIVDANDETDFPLIGTENINQNGHPLMSDNDFVLFAHNILNLFKLRCPELALKIVWDYYPLGDIDIPAGFGEGLQFNGTKDDDIVS